MGEVIELPVRTCFLCCHYGESHCHVFDERIDSELYAAQDCDAYEVSV